MSIRTATILAIIGLGLGLVMSLGGQYLLNSISRSFDLQAESFRLISTIYFDVKSVLQEGSLLVFFISLFLNQRAKDRA
jgi:hypothetical protein